MDTGLNQDVFLMGLHRKLIKASDTLSPGLPRTRKLSIFTIFPSKQHLHEPCIGLLVQGTLEAEESILAQLHSQGKFTILRCKNKKY
jgi:hypothetical protein